MWRHLSQIYFPNLFYKNLGLDKEMHTSKLTKCFTLSVISDYHLVRWYQLQIHAIPDSHICMWVYRHTSYQARIWRIVKNNPQNFCNHK